MDIQIFSAEFYKELSKGDWQMIDIHLLKEIAEWGTTGSTPLSPLSKEAEELARVLTTVFAWLEFTDRI